MATIMGLPLSIFFSMWYRVQPYCTEFIGTKGILIDIRVIF